jgi:hypothetical protein
MSKDIKISIDFQNGLDKLGFDRNDDSLFLISDTKQLPDPQIQFHIEKAEEFEASAVYLRTKTSLTLIKL